MELLATKMIAALLVSLRIGPTLSFAPPFTLMRVPISVRVILSICVSYWLVDSFPDQTIQALSDEMLVQAVILELFFGILLALSLQLAFAAILVAGRAIDIQAGFGLALLADPTLRSRMPLVGTLFAYAAGIVFFSSSGPADLLFLWRDSLERIPIGGLTSLPHLEVILSYISAVFMVAIGLAGLIFLSLFLIDLTIAFLSRTLPQMNVLLLGFQVKTIALLAVLPIVFTVSGALFLRLIRMALDAPQNFY